MRILYLNPDRGIPVLGDKGASVHVRELVGALKVCGHEVVLAYANEGRGNSPPPARMVRISPETSDAEVDSEWACAATAEARVQDRVVRRELAKLHYDHAFCKRVLSALDRIGFSPDIIYERHALFHCAGAEVARIAGVPRLLEVNAPLIQEQERFRGLALTAEAVDAERRSFHGADAIFAVSREVAAYVTATGISASVVHTVPNGVDLERFRPCAGGSAVRARYGLDDSPVVGFVGSFKPWHGIEFLVESFAAIAREVPAVHLLCVGEGPGLDSARQSISAHGLASRAVFTGRVPHVEIPAYLAAMDLTAAPYLPTTDFYFSPLKVVESMAAGTPVIAARMGQLQDLVDHGTTGFLFTAGNGPEFVTRVAELLADPQRLAAMSSRARARAEAEFGWDRVAKRIANEADRLIARNCAA